MSNIFEKLDSVLYEVSIEGILPNENTPLIFQRYIQDVSVYSYYSTCVFPIIELNLMLPRYYYTKIQENANEILFLMNIKRFKVSSMQDKNASLLFTNFLTNEILKPYDIPRTSIPPVSKNVTIKNNDINDESNNETFPMKISCFLKRHLDYNKQPNFAVFNNIQIDDIFMYLLNNNNVNNNVLIQPSDNEKFIEQVIIPPLSMTRSFQYLQEVYGCYKYGMQIFFDLKYNYILGKNKVKNTPIPKGIRYDKYNTIYIQFIKSDQPNTGSKIDKEHNVIKLLIPDNNSSFIVNDATSREIGGEVVKFMSRTNVNNSIGRSYKIMYGIDDDNLVTNSDLPKELVLWNNYSNQFLEYEYKANLSRDQLINTVTWVDIDLDLLMPHKNFQIEYETEEYAKYNGTYQLISNVFKFVKNGTESKFRVIGNSNFTKVNKDLQE